MILVGNLLNGLWIICIDLILHTAPQETCLRVPRVTLLIHTINLQIIELIHRFYTLRNSKTIGKL